MRKLLVVTLVLMVAGSAAQAITLGQEDTFQLGGTQGWTPGALQYSAGPAGVGDTCLRVSSTGSGDAATLRTVNTGLRWTRNYLEEGVTAIEADLVNLGSVELDLRVLLYAANSGQFTSTEAFVLPPDGQWHHARFGLSASELTCVSPLGGDLNAVLHVADLLVLRHQSGSPLGLEWNTPIVSQMAIDNIQAVPEPLGILLFTAGGILFAGRRATLRK